MAYFSLFGSQYNVLPLSCGDLFDVISFCGVFVEIGWIVGLWSDLSMNNIWIFSEFIYVWLSYLCKSLRIIGLVWPTRLIFLAMGEVLSFGFNLAVSFPSDSRGSKARIVLLPSRIKRWVYIILHEFIPLHHVILLKELLGSYEHNTLDACWIAVYVWSNSSKCK